ncbi:MAG: hypothetical protein ACYC6C_12420 [Coriobacteriia bacterium]
MVARTSSLVGVALLALAACGSTDGAGTPINDAGTGDTASHDGSDSDAVTHDAGPCVATGTWLITTSPEAGSPESETVVVADGNGDEVTSSFADRETPVDQCLPPTDAGVAMGTSSQLATFDASACVLVLAWTESYCHSGEQQCESATYELTVSGDTATGRLHEKRGWCMDPSSTDTPVTAVRTE